MSWQHLVAELHGVHPTGSEGAWELSGKTKAHKTVAQLRFTRRPTGCGTCRMYHRLMDGETRLFELQRGATQALKKEADALYLAAELIRTGSPSLAWIDEVLRSAELNRMERTDLLEKLRSLEPPQ